jgi:hypothetical protein
VSNGNNPNSATAQPAAPQPIGKLFLDPRADGIDFTWQQALVQGLSSVNPAGVAQIQIDAGFDFYWVASSQASDVAEAAQTNGSLVVPLVTVLISDTGSQKQLMNFPVPIGSIFGSGYEPYRLLIPRLVRGNAVLQFSFTSYVASGTTYSNIYLVLHGFRLPAGSPYTL